MHQQLQAEQHYGHPVLLCCGSYGNLKEHQMFYLKCEGIICDIVPPSIYGARNSPNPHDFSNWLNYLVLKSLFTLQIHPHTAAFVLAYFLEWCLLLMVTGGLEPIPVDIGWGLENPERSHADMGGTCKLQPQSPRELNPQLPQLEFVANHFVRAKSTVTKSVSLASLLRSSQKCQTDLFDTDL